MEYYYFRTLEKITSGVMSLFNNIKTSKFTYDSVSSDWIRNYHIVQLEMATREKILLEYEQSKSSQVKRYFNTPRMAISIVGISRYIEKQTNQMNIILSGNIIDSSEGRRIVEYVKNPSWWKASYKLNIITRKIDDMAQILEQIVPVFQPQRSISIKIIPELEVSLLLETTISDSIQFNINEELDAQSQRLIESSIDISVPIPMFPPISDSAVIKTIISRFTPVSSIDYRRNQYTEEFFMYGDHGPSSSIKLSALMSET